MTEINPSVEIRVPATTANLGAGFDCLAVALNLWNQVGVEFGGKGYRVRIRGEGADILPVNEENLIVRAFLETGKKLGIKMPAGAVFHCENHIPLGSGLGSSAAAGLTGIIAATTLAPDHENKDTWLQLSAELEGHADNVAAAIFGGLVAVRKVKGKYRTILYDVEPEDVIIVLPDIKVSTHDMRAALPESIPVTDAVFNLSRVPAILDGLQSGDVDVLRDGLEDLIHQPYRLPLVPGAAEAIEAANKAGAAAALSGAGPSVVAFMPVNNELVADAMTACFTNRGIENRVFHLEMINRGAMVTRL